MTKFQERVYNVVRQIRHGQTMTYQEVARAADYPQAARAVGNALSKNYDHEVPCYRVIRSDGKAGGYNRGKELKSKLLREENALRATSD